MNKLQTLLHAFKESGSSDLHLTSGSAPYIRLYGELCLLKDFPVLDAEQLAELTSELVGKENIEKFNAEKELDMAIGFEGFRMRINLYRQQQKIAWALRLLPSEFFPLGELGIPLPILTSVCKMQKGLVLVTGATGSGKSTTLASIINAINQTRNCHIFTIEDPVEYCHQNQKAFISQREVDTDTVSFEEALRRVFREDPDVILIGEMRDQITMRAALTLAETGHLTFGTLHTSEAIQTVTRMIGAFPANEQEQIRTQLATTLNLVISQQLVRWSDGQGRSVASEVMIGTPAIKAMIRENKIHHIASCIQTGQQMGMRTMNMSLAELVEKKRISSERALESSLDKEDLKRILKRS
ncbi:MAG: PilT/PilU family type 4a pilus ATPase [Lentisphaeria bacterium]